MTLEGRRLLITIAGFTALTVLAARPAVAQGTAGPHITSGLFGDGKVERPTRQRLTFLLDSTEAFDSDLPDAATPALAPHSLQSGGYSTALMVSGDYERRRPRIEFRASTSSAFRYFAAVDDARMIAGTAAAGMTSRLSVNSRLLANQTVSYSPSYLYQLLLPAVPAAPGASPITGPDYTLAELRSYSYGTRVGWSHDSIAAGKVDLTAQFDRVDFQGRSVGIRPDVRIYGLKGEYAHAFSRSTRLSFGYQVRGGEFGYGGATTEQAILAGFNYSRALSRTRRAELRLNVMPAIVDIPASAQYVENTGRLYRVSADAAFGYPFYRTWRATLNARRQLEFIAPLPEPVFSDVAGTTLDGYLTRRFYLSLSAAYANAQSALTPDAFTFETYTGDAQLRYALTRSVGLYVGSLYYFYDFRGKTSLLRSIPRRLERTGVRAGLMLWIPAIGR